MTEININLRVISQLNEGDKLLVKKNLMKIDRSHGGVLNAVTRWWNEEGRSQTIIRINELIRNAFEEIGNQKNICLTPTSTESIKENLARCINGLKELRKTYSEDPTMVAQLDVIIEEITKNTVKIPASHPNGHSPVSYTSLGQKDHSSDEESNP